MSGYIPNPTDVTQPLGTVDAKTAAAEFRALKGYIQTFANVEPTWNPLDRAPIIGLVSGNLTPISAVQSNTLSGLVRATAGKTGSQKYYFELIVGSSNGIVEVGVGTINTPIWNGTTSVHLGADANSIGWRNDGTIWYGGVQVFAGINYAPFDVLGIDFSAIGSVSFYRFNVLVATVNWTGTLSNFPKYPMVGLQLYNDYVVTNFGTSNFVNPLPADAVPFYEPSAPVNGPQNLIINSDMIIDQRNNHAALVPIVNTNFVSDRWGYASTMAGIFNAQANLTNAADQLATQGCLAYNRFVVAATTVPGAADYAMVTQKVEGIKIGRLLYGSSNSRVMTLSFWFRTDTFNFFTGIIQNAASTRSFLFNFGANGPIQLNVWNKVSIVIPGCDDGAWNVDTNIGMYVGICLGAGVNYEGPATGVWTAADDRKSFAGQNFCNQANASYFDFTGFELKPGYFSPSAPREIIDISVAATECFRYYKKQEITNAGYINAGGTIGMNLPLPVPMRANPGGTISSNANTNCSNSTFTALGNTSALISSVGTALGAFIQHCFVAADAEL